jgi:hypothetical protein
VISRREFAGASLLIPSVALAAGGPVTVTGATSLDIEIPDAPLVTVRLSDFTPDYPGNNGGRIDMRTSADGVSFPATSGRFSWVFSETYDDLTGLYTASAADHNMSDRVRLCTAISKAGGAEFELTFTRPYSTRQKLWRWVGNSVYIDGLVCGYQGYAVQKSTAPITAIRLFPDLGSFSLTYEVIP